MNEIQRFPRTIVDKEVPIHTLVPGQSFEMCLFTNGDRIRGKLEYITAGSVCITEDGHERPVHWSRETLVVPLRHAIIRFPRTKPRRFPRTKPRRFPRTRPRRFPRT